MPGLGGGQADGSPTAAGTDPVRIRPRGQLDAEVGVPGSRSVTNRALLAAALADGESLLVGALESDDTLAMSDCLRGLGSQIDPGPEAWRVLGTNGAWRVPAAPLQVRQSGTTARFVTAAATLAPGPCVVDGAERMRERPIADLVEALGQLGATVEILGHDGCPPLRTHGGGLEGGEAVIDASRSSQYVSAVLLAAPYARRDVHLRFRDGRLVSRPYVELTLDVMQQFGAQVAWEGEDGLLVRAGKPYRPRKFRVEPDASSATYPLAAAAIAGGRVRVGGLTSASHQADVGFAGVLARMGCGVETDDGGIAVTGPRGALRAIDIDMNAMPDAALTLAVVALFADGPSHIRNVANLRIKESDRLAVLASELTKLGGRARIEDDGLVVEPGPLRGAEIDPHDDHRMAMAFALAGLRIPGVAIREPGCVAKTWPNYFAMLECLTEACAG